MRIQFKIDKDALDKLDRVDLRGAMVRGAKMTSKETAKYIMDHKVSGQLLQVRSGDLRRNIRGDAYSRGQKVTMVVGAYMPYARIQEEGGIITPKTGKFLTIPLPGIKTRKGVTRGGARSFPNTWVWKEGEPWLIMQRIGKSGKSRPLFMLLKSVKIKPKRYLRTGLMDRLDDIQHGITREILRLF